MRNDKQNSLSSPSCKNQAKASSNEQPRLIDPFGRQVNYLRVSLTDRCNLRCTYCMSEKMTFLPKTQVLSLEEIYTISKAFVELGVSKIRLTGGEPLVRKGAVELVESLAKLPNLHELVMTTNAILLPEFAQPLKQAGMQRLNISLDSLNDANFTKISRIAALPDVLAGIKAAQQAGFEKIKINAVIMAGVNDHEVLDLANFAINEGLDISFIEEMPLGDISSHQRQDTQFTSASIRDTLTSALNLLEQDNEQGSERGRGFTGGPSRYMQVANSQTKIGFISPLSNNFCSTCNRVRLTVEGRLLLCLGNEHSVDLRQIVRENPSDLSDSIRQAMRNKPERHHFDPTQTEIVRFMNMTGG